MKPPHQNANRANPEPELGPDDQEVAEREAGQAPQQTQPAEERGERVDTGKLIARGGKDAGKVPGASEEKP